MAELPPPPGAPSPAEAPDDGQSVVSFPTRGRPGRGAGPASPVRGHDRTPPHNLDAEVSVIGGMLLSRNAIAEVTELCSPEDFYRGAHRTLYEAIRDLYDRGEPADVVTVANLLAERSQLEDVGGPDAIFEITTRVPTAANALYYARIVAEHALRRKLIEAGTDITRLGYDVGVGAVEAVDTSESLIYDVGQGGRRSSEFRSMRDLVRESFELIEKLHENNSSVTGLETGFADLDELTAGLQPGNLIIVAARPSMGKSTLVTNIATHVAATLRRPVAMFSLEMSTSELTSRILAAEARVDSKRLRTGALKDSDWPKLSQALGRVAEAPLFLDDNSAINLMEIRSKARRLKQQHGLDLVIIDYLQLMQSHRRAENRVQEVSEISRGLKVLAKELDVPVIALSQLSRKPEERTDKRPILSDLRESGCLPGRARVLRADTGAEETMGSLHARGARNVPVWTLDEELRLVHGVMTHVFPTGVKGVYRLRLASGRRIEATSNHPFLAYDGWTRLDELVPGMHVAVPRGVAPARAPVAMTDHHRGVADVLEDPRLRQLASPDVHWDAVRDIELMGEEPTFDGTVPGTHNFIADGVVVHNSIEQDADVVAFIYRDDFYDDQSPNAGEAELIVSKHRNGALRTIRLSFLGHHSRFASMARGGPPPPSGGGPI